MKKYLNVCKHCKQEFETIKEDKIFCCSNHKVIYNRVPPEKTEFACECCGKIFHSHKKNLRACSRKCISKLQNENLRAKKYVEHEEKYRDVENIPTCKVCGYKSTSLQTHLINHNLTVHEYKDKFNVTNDEVFHSSYIDDLSDRIKGNKNPAYKHGGKYSPYSDKFVKYEGLNGIEGQLKKDEVFKKMHATQKNNGNYTTTIDYYLNKGMPMNEAVEALTNRQTTFSLDICIGKYGKEEGIKIWQDRQDKWLGNYRKSNYSKVSQVLFKKIHHFLDDVECFYANVNSDDTNDEFVLKTKNSFVKPDFYIPEWDKIIEFDGDYWHQPKNAGSAKTHEEDRDNDILEQYSDMRILHVKEQDYRNNKDGVVKQCLEFLHN